MPASPEGPPGPTFAVGLLGRRGSASTPASERAGLDRVALPCVKPLTSPPGRGARHPASLWTGRSGRSPKFRRRTRRSFYPAAFSEDFLAERRRTGVVDRNSICSREGGGRSTCCPASSTTGSRPAAHCSSPGCSARCGARDARLAVAVTPRSAAGSARNGRSRRDLGRQARLERPAEQCLRREVFRSGSPDAATAPSSTAERSSGDGIDGATGVAPSGVVPDVS